MAAADRSAAATVSCRASRTLSGARLSAFAGRAGASTVVTRFPGTLAMGGGAARRSRLVTLAGPAGTAIRFNAEALIQIAGFLAQAASPSLAPGVPTMRICMRVGACLARWLALQPAGLRLSRGCDRAGKPADLGHLGGRSALNRSAFSAVVHPDVHQHGFSAVSPSGSAGLCYQIPSERVNHQLRLAITVS